MIAVEPKYAVGQWILCEFVLQVIRRMDGDRITEVGDGHFAMSGKSLNDVCFPLDVEGKVLSEIFSDSYERVRDSGGNINLNCPDIKHRFLCEWCAAMHAREDRNVTDKCLKDLREMEALFIEEIKEMREQRVRGVLLLRR